MPALPRTGRPPHGLLREWNDVGDPRHPHVIVCAMACRDRGVDFDTLARRLCAMVCPDVAGAAVDWLTDPMDYQRSYVRYWRCWHSCNQQAPIATLTRGTSMGGASMGICGVLRLLLPAPVRRPSGTNIVGPCLEWWWCAAASASTCQPAHFDLRCSRRPTRCGRVQHLRAAHAAGVAEPSRAMVRPDSRAASRCITRRDRFGLSRALDAGGVSERRAADAALRPDRGAGPVAAHVIDRRRRRRRSR